MLADAGVSLSGMRVPGRCNYFSRGRIHHNTLSFQRITKSRSGVFF
jgi:hypothetical protein